MLTTKYCKTQAQPPLIIFEYQIVMQSEQYNEEGVPEKTEEFVCPFFQPMNEQTLKDFFDWRDIGFHLAAYWLREICHRPEGGFLATPIWRNASYSPESDEF